MTDVFVEKISAGLPPIDLPLRMHSADFNQYLDYLTGIDDSRPITIVGLAPEVNKQRPSIPAEIIKQTHSQQTGDDNRLNDCTTTHREELDGQVLMREQILEPNDRISCVQGVAVPNNMMQSEICPKEPNNYAEGLEAINIENSFPKIIKQGTAPPQTSHSVSISEHSEINPVGDREENSCGKSDEGTVLDIQADGTREDSISLFPSRESEKPHIQENMGETTKISDAKTDGSYVSTGCDLDRYQSKNRPTGRQKAPRKRGIARTFVRSKHTQERKGLCRR